MKKKWIKDAIQLGIKTKMWKIMRLSAFFLFLFLSQAWASSSYSQQTKLTLKMGNASILDVLDAIENNSEFYFVFNQKLVDVERKVDVDVKNQTIDKVLNDMFAETDVHHTVKDKLIILTTEKTMEKANPQKAVKGKIIDKDGQPIPGATVVVKSTGNGTVTNVNGEFTISDVTQDAILTVSFVGFVSQDIPVDGLSEINVTLLEDLKQLDEVVVVGYGTKKKRDISGAITSVSGETLNEMRSESFAQALQGRAAGVYVKSNSGQPGGGVSVRIRGMGGLNNSEPLYIIDGVQMGGAGSSDDNNPLAMINTNDIESVEILKDASSSAIYGARAANGVVIITTRRGQTGAPKFSYSGTFGIQTMSNPNNFELLNANQYATIVNETLIGDGKDPIFGGSNPQYPSDLFPAPSSLGEGTDWLGAVTQSAPVQEHQVSVSGGTTKNKYYLSVNYMDQDGIMVNTFFKRFSARVNTDNDIAKWLKIGNSLMVSNSSSNVMKQYRGGETGTLNNTLTLAPTLPVYNNDGTFAGPEHGFYPPKRNPLAELTNIERDNKTTNVIGNIYADLKLYKGLSFKTSFSANISNNRYDHFEPTYVEGTNSRSVTDVRANTLTNTSWIWNNVLSYNLSHNKHNLSMLAGTEAIEMNLNLIESEATYTDNSIRVVSAQGSETHGVNQYKSASSLISYFGNASYNYDNKYYIEGSIRRDGSSRFGSNNRWGVFPSVSGAWRVSQEDFFSSGIIDDFKLRASYGKVGNDKIGDYTYLAGIKNVFYGFGDVGGVFSNGLAIDALGNPELKWETSEQINFGIDLTMLDNKLSVTADYFETDVKDMLIGLPIPALTGISASTDVILTGEIMSNAGSLTNKGFELEASYRDKIGKFTYSIGANITTYNNEVTDIGANDQLWGMAVQGQNVSRTVKGGNLGEFYGYVVEGIFQTQAEVDAANALNGNTDIPYQYANTGLGDYKYKDINGDGVADAKDRTTIGSPVPDFTYGLSLDLGYKDFSLSMLWSGTQGNEIFNANRKDLEASGRLNFNKSKTVLDSWSGPNTSNTIARRIESDPNDNRRMSSIFVEDGSYLALRNIKLSYNFPEKIISKLKLSDAQVFLSGQNLLMFTKYSGFDPEVGNLNGNNLNAGIDNDLYPHASTVNIGVIINL